MRGTVLTAVPAMEAMIPINPVRRTLLNAPLRAYCRAGAASHAGFRDVVSLPFTPASIAQNLHAAVFHQFLAEIFSLAVKK